MHAEHFVLELLVLDDSSQGQVLKHVIDALEDTVRVVDVLAESLLAFFAETEMPVDCAVFMVATEQDNLLGVLQLQGHQQADNFETECASVHVISEEDIVEGLDITLLTRALPDIEEPHQVDIVSVQVAENLDWWLQPFYQNRLGLQHGLTL